MVRILSVDVPFMIPQAKSSEPGVNLSEGILLPLIRGAITKQESGRVKIEVHIAGADMGHVSFAQQKPRNGAADNRKLAFEAPEYLTDLDEHRFDRCCRPVVVVTG